MKVAIFLSILAFASAGVSKLPLQDVKVNWLNDVLENAISVILSQAGDLDVGTFPVADAGELSDAVISVVDDGISVEVTGPSNRVTVSITISELILTAISTVGELSGVQLPNPGQLILTCTSSEISFGTKVKFSVPTGVVLESVTDLSITCGGVSVSLDGVEYPQLGLLDLLLEQYTTVIQEWLPGFFNEGFGKSLLSN